MAIVRRIESVEEYNGEIHAEVSFEGAEGTYPVLVELDEGEGLPRRRARARALERIYALVGQSIDP